MEGRRHGGGVADLRLLEDLLENAGDEARRYLDEKRRSAASRLARVSERQRALWDVADAVARTQREFLDGRLKYPPPLSSRAVGADIGLPVSTISRVIANKSIETPRGLFDLAFFFDLRTGSA